MRIILFACIALFLAAGLSACGTKGKLKTPSQVEAQKAKDAAKEKTEDDASNE